MRVLVVGTGGREHALVAALVADPEVSAVVAAPGNPGMGRIAQVRDVDLLDPADVARVAIEAGVDLVVVGPEAPLVAGVADAVRAAGIACFGPSGAAAQIEGSKVFAKDVMAVCGVATARFRLCTNQVDVELALKTFGPPYVVKDDSLAAGKGVVVTADFDDAVAHAVACGRVVVEEYLDGPEVSLFVVTDGVAAVPLPLAQDYKRLRDGDAGPNTGGMGSYAPISWAPADLVPKVMRSVVEPVLATMRDRGLPFVGLLYVGLALTSNGPRVVEFNARFGDPEAQVLLPLLKTPPSRLLHAAATGRLAQLPPLQWHDAAAVSVVIAAPGYPTDSSGEEVILGATGAGHLHAGTRLTESGDLVTTGGRAICCTAMADTLAAARDRAYELVAQVRLEGGVFRTDIAQQ